MCAKHEKNEEQIYYEAMSKPSDERQAYIKEACGDDAELLARVEALLKAHEIEDSFLEKPAFGSDVTLKDSPLTEGPGTRIGRYKILQLIGEGGFGCVYMADQEEPVRRRVALKIIKLGMDTKQVIARFEAERQALAMMDHPNIARVLDAGATDTGRPYFVMELVKGIPITEYCDKNNLNTRQRLGLFIDVCKAVQHAHQKGVIHRDIKPSNVMITLHDGKPVPKIIDFGIAKATQHRLTERTFFTEYQQFIGTPEYMSPEQAELSGLDVDTRTDIYSLGVLLYELLTGSTPFERKQLMSAAYDEIRRIICETDPPKPSVRLSTLGDALTDVAKHRHVQPGELCKIVRGDLDWVVMKTLEKDRTRRYETANELAADISRHLGDEPVSAGPPSVRYRMRKFVRRNRAWVAGTAAVLVVLAAGIVVSTIFAIGQFRARAEAKFYVQIKEAADEYIKGGFFAKGPETTIREVLDTASKDLDGSSKYLEEMFGPLVEPFMRGMLGTMYLGLGLHEEAELHLARAHQFFRDELGEEHRATLESMNDLALLYSRQGRYDESEALYVKALENQRDTLGEEHSDMLDSMFGLGKLYVMQGRYDEAESLYVKMLEVGRRTLGEEHGLTVSIMYELGKLCQSADKRDRAIQLLKKVVSIPCPLHGDLCPETLDATYRLAQLSNDKRQYDEAEQRYVKALEKSRRELGEEDSWTLWSMDNLAKMYTRQGRYDEAEQLYVKVLETRRRVLGEEHRNTLWSMGALGWVYSDQGRYDEAEALFVKGLETSRRVFGEEHRRTLWSMEGLGWVYSAQGRYNEAEALLVKALETSRQVFGEEDRLTLWSMEALGWVYCEQVRYEEAEPLLVKALEGHRRLLGEDHPDTLISMHNLASLYSNQSRYDEAEALFVKALEGRRRVMGEEHPRTLESINNLIELYEAWGKPEEAEKWQANLPDKEGTE